MRSKFPHILLVNPWIHDFAAYDFWAKPLGLLTLGGILREHGARISFLDCLDRFHPFSPAGPSPSARCGRGPYLKTVIAKPPGLADIPRTFCRYGIPEDWFRKDLAALDPPDLVMVTSLMTYWYPGVRETIGVVKSVFPDVPVVLGGVYATLCADHARSTCGADRVVSGPGESAILPLVGELTGWSPVSPGSIHRTWMRLPRPALDLEHRSGACAGADLTRLPVPVCLLRLPPASAPDDAAQFRHRSWKKSFTGIKNTGFTISPFTMTPCWSMPTVTSRPCWRDLSPPASTCAFTPPMPCTSGKSPVPLARLMFRAGFHTIRLGLETTAFEGRQAMDRKVTEAEFVRTVEHLKAAGFNTDQVGAYLLAGLPGQDVSRESRHSIALVKAGRRHPGDRPLYPYSPHPHVAGSGGVVALRPGCRTPFLPTTPSFPAGARTFSWEVLTRLKNLARA